MRKFSKINLLVPNIFLLFTYHQLRSLRQIPPICWGTFWSCPTCYLAAFLDALLCAVHRRVCAEAEVVCTGIEAKWFRNPTWRFPKVGDPQVTMGFNTQSWSSMTTGWCKGVAPLWQTTWQPSRYRAAQESKHAAKFQKTLMIKVRQGRPSGQTVFFF